MSALPGVSLAVCDAWVLLRIFFLCLLVVVSLSSGALIWLQAVLRTIPAFSNFCLLNLKLVHSSAG